MKKGLFTALVVSGWVAAAFAQQAPQKEKLAWHPVVQAGVAAGEQGPAVELQALGLVHYKTWAGGAGAGIHYYQFRTVPLFATVHKRVFKTLESPFAYGSLGIDLPWVKKPIDEGYASHDYKSGLFYEAGIGYRWPLSAKQALLLSAGYSVKRLRDWQQEPYLWGPPDMPVRIYKNFYEMQLVTLKAGFSF